MRFVVVLCECEWTCVPRSQIRAVRSQAADAQPPCSAAGAAGLLYFVEDEEDEEEEDRWRGLLLLLRGFYSLPQSNVKELYLWRNVAR